MKRRIKDERLIKLFDKIINSEKRAFGLPLGVDPCEIDPREMLFDKGMPIGNLTSQMFANIYMNELDQYLKHELHLKYVIRVRRRLYYFTRQQRGTMAGIGES